MEELDKTAAMLPEETDGLLETILEHTHVLVAYLDPQFNFLRVNRAYAEADDREPAFFPGQNHFELYPNADNEEIFRRVAETGEPYFVHAKPFEYAEYPERGVTFWDWSLVPIKGSGGNVTGLVLTLADVTDQVRADEALQEALEASQRRQTEVSALLEASRAVLGFRDFEASARSIFDASKSLIGATSGYLALLSDDGTENELLFLDSEEAPCSVDPTLTMPIRGLRETVYRTGQVVFENGFSGSEWARLLPQGHADLDNVLFAPLKINEVVVGLLGLANKPGGFEDNDTHLASAFGELAAVALLNSRATESLQESEERFRSVAQSATDAIITADRRGVVVFWNQAAASIFGYTQAEAVGKPLSMIMPERLRPAHQQGMERLLSTGQPRILGKTVEMIGQRKGGHEFPVELSLSSWETKRGVFFTGILRDITERRQAREEIESLARFPSENRNPVLRVSRDGTIRYANQASAPLLAEWGTQIGQPLPHGMRDLVVDALGSGESRKTRVTCDERVFSLDLAPVQEAGYVNLYGRDITERVRVEEQLREKNRFIMNVFESLRHPFYVIDANDYTIKMANPAAYRGDFSGGVTCYALTHQQSTPCSGHGQRCPLEEIRRTRAPVLLEHMHYDQEGNRRCYEVHGHPILDGDGNVTQIIEYTLDITERKRAEEALRERTHELAERVKELNCLYGISTLMEKPGISLSQILQGTVELLPPAWQYPELACARILLGDQEYSTDGYRDTVWTQTTDIMVGGERVGAVEVCYLEARPESDEEPFLEEERLLLRAIAERLGRIVEKVRMEGQIAAAMEALREREALLSTISVNYPAYFSIVEKDWTIGFTSGREFAKRNLDPESFVGLTLDEVFGEQAALVKENYIRAFEGEEVSFELSRDDQYQLYNAVPLRSGGGEIESILAVVENITERRLAEEALRLAHDELEQRVEERTVELAEANEELRRAALRNAELYAAELRARQTAETLSAASLALTQTLELDTTISTLLDFVGRVVPYDSASIMLPHDETDFVVRAVRGSPDSQELLGTSVDLQASPHLRSLLASQKSTLISDTRYQPEWKGCPLMEGAQSWLGVPLVAGDSVIGICSLGRAEPGSYTQQHVLLVEALVGQAAVTVQNAWLFQQVRSGRERLRALSRRLVEVQETERRYIARELHDEAGQALTSLMVGLRLLEREAQHPDAIIDGVAELKQMVNGVIEDLHRLAMHLRPASLDHLGLVAALRQYAEGVSHQQELTVQFEAVGLTGRLPTEIEATLYRIVQEALTNVIRHAQATRVDVLLDHRGDNLIVLVEDNGVGFDPAAVERSGRLGIFGMRERTETLGGTLTIESGARSGTTVLMEVPYVNKGTHRG